MTTTKSGLMRTEGGTRSRWSKSCAHQAAHGQNETRCANRLWLAAPAAQEIVLTAPDVVDRGVSELAAGHAFAIAAKATVDHLDVDFS